MNKRGKIAVEVLIVLVVMIFTSALILVLVKTGVIAVRSDVTTQPVLNAEFLPGERIGNLVITNFEFCGSIDEDFNCLDPKQKFSPGNEIHFGFVVRSTVYNGEIALVENYKLISSSGDVVLEADQNSNFNVDMKSKFGLKIIFYLVKMLPRDNIP